MALRDLERAACLGQSTAPHRSAPRFSRQVIPALSFGGRSSRTWGEMGRKSKNILLFGAILKPLKAVSCGSPASSSGRAVAEDAPALIQLIEILRHRTSQN